MTGPVENETGEARSWRDRKRQAAKERIFACAMRLFLDQGYEGTTVEAIAEAAGVSRRSVFDYFRTKEDILFAGQDALPSLVRLGVGAGRIEAGPVEAARDALFQISDRYDRQVETFVDRLGGSSERVQAGRRMRLIRLEQALVDGLAERWPGPQDAGRLAVIAMISVGALRLAIDRWVRDPAARSLWHHYGAVLEAIGEDAAPTGG